MNENSTNDTTRFILLMQYPDGMEQWEIVNTKIEAENHARIAYYRGAVIVLTVFSDDDPFDMSGLIGAK